MSKFLHWDQATQGRTNSILLYTVCWEEKMRVLIPQDCITGFPLCNSGNWLFFFCICRDKEQLRPLTENCELLLYVLFSPFLLNFLPCSGLVTSHFRSDCLSSERSTWGKTGNAVLGKRCRYSEREVIHDDTKASKKSQQTQRRQ